MPGYIANKVDRLMDKAIGNTFEGVSLFSFTVNYNYGGGGVITNSSQFSLLDVPMTLQ